MRFTHYMQYFVDLEGGKWIPVSVFFWRPMCNFSRGVLITIYNISWWWWLVNRVCPRQHFTQKIRAKIGGTNPCENRAKLVLNYIDPQLIIVMHKFWQNKSSTMGLIAMSWRDQLMEAFSAKYCNWQPIYNEINVKAIHLSLFGGT